MPLYLKRQWLSTGPLRFSLSRRGLAQSAILELVWRVRPLTAVVLLTIKHPVCRSTLSPPTLPVLPSQRPARSSPSLRNDTVFPDRTARVPLPQLKTVVVIPAPPSPPATVPQFYSLVLASMTPCRDQRPSCSLRQDLFLLCSHRDRRNSDRITTCTRLGPPALMVTDSDSCTADAVTRTLSLVCADRYLRPNLPWGPWPRSDIICSWDDALADARVYANDWLPIGSQQVRCY